MLTLMSWNVNGIRAALRNGFLDFLKKYQPDILALQEVKIAEKDRSDAKLDFPGYTEIWHSAERPGYSGTAVLVKQVEKKSSFLKRGLSDELARGVPQRKDEDVFSTTPKIIKISNGLNHNDFDKEGRVQTLEFAEFYFVNAYFPNSRHDLSRLDFKIEFNNKIFSHIKKLEKKKPVIFTGDFNVAHTEIDLKNPKENEHNAGFTIEERTSFDKFLKNGLLDTFRTLHPKEIKYSWWGYKFHCRERNIGWRIDYFVVSEKLKNKIQKAEILNKVMGSDHCPIKLEINL